MAWTNPNFYLSALFLAIALFPTLAIVGTDLVTNDRIDLNEDSVDYILELKGINDESGYQTVAETESAETNQKGILDSEDEKTVSESGDFLSTLYVKKERAAQPTNLFKLAYNLPTTILKGLKLPISEFSHLTNILSYFIFISLMIMVWVKWVRT